MPTREMAEGPSVITFHPLPRYPILLQAVPRRWDDLESLGEIARIRKSLTFDNWPSLFCFAHGQHRTASSSGRGNF